MIINKNVVAAVALLLGASLQADAHAAISPMLGVKGKPQRSNVQRPSVAKPCGNVNIAQALDSSTAIPLNFNAGIDGSLQIVSASVDVTGTGKSFEPAHVRKNGERNPSQIKSQQLSVLIPSGCKGGKTKNKCLVTFTTAGGFGNCVVVQAPAKKAREAEEDEIAEDEEEDADWGDSDDAEDADAENMTYYRDGAVGTRAARAMRLAEEGSA
ncbi:hypothetical protein C8Q80DRAFT_1266011 [Daedaleopsis nitida]|nr:hypothetical protein C8Q80DRAFT_1266011 [Daedaleopsis nitida]